MAQRQSVPARQRLSGEDLTFWRTDSPMQPTTMAMLMLLDRVPRWIARPYEELF
jgi:hypothetical protein